MYLPLLTTEAVSVGEGAGEVEQGPGQHQLAGHHLHHTATGLTTLGPAATGPGQGGLRTGGLLLHT